MYVNICADRLVQGPCLPTEASITVTHTKVSDAVQCVPCKVRPCPDVHSKPGYRHLWLEICCLVLSITLIHACAECIYEMLYE